MISEHFISCPEAFQDCRFSSHFLSKQITFESEYPLRWKVIVTSVPGNIPSFCSEFWQKIFSHSCFFIYHPLCSHLINVILGEMTPPCRNLGNGVISDSLTTENFSHVFLSADRNLQYKHSGKTKEEVEVSAKKKKKNVITFQNYRIQLE